MHRRAILILGQKGTEKLSVATMLARYISDRLEESVNSPAAAAWDVDTELGLQDPGKLSHFMNSDRWTQRREWVNAFRRIRSQIDDRRMHTAIVCADGHYWYQNECFCALDPEEIVDFRPSAVVTLVDDIYDITYRLRNLGQSAANLFDQFSLVDALLWRSLEMQLGEHLGLQLEAPGGTAGNAGSKVSLPRRSRHFMIAVKHSIETLYSIVSDGPTRRAYLSFPVSHTRLRRALREELQRHRERVHKNIPTLDPVSIDERRFLPNKDDPPTGLAERWPIVPLQPMAQGEEYGSTEFKPEELCAAKPLILGDLRARAFKYVQQSEVIIVYRPFWDTGRLHRGVGGEIRLGCAASKTVVVFDPDEGDLSAVVLPVGPKGIHCFKDPTQYYEMLANVTRRTPDPGTF